MKYVGMFLYEDNKKYIVLIRRREYKIKKQFDSVEDAKLFLSSYNFLATEKNGNTA